MSERLTDGSLDKLSTVAADSHLFKQGSRELTAEYIRLMAAELQERRAAEAKATKACQCPLCQGDNVNCDDQICAACKCCSYCCECMYEHDACKD